MTSFGRYLNLPHYNDGTVQLLYIFPVMSDLDTIGVDFHSAPSSISTVAIFCTLHFKFCGQFSRPQLMFIGFLIYIGIYDTH